MNDNDLFEKKFRIPNTLEKKLKKPKKRLLKSKYQIEALKKTIKIAKQIKKYPQIKNVFIGGSVINKRLGKYQKQWVERKYSDIDLFILVKNKISDVSTTYKKLKKIGLTKQYIKSKDQKYYRTCVANKDNSPMYLFDKFEVSAWLMSKYTLPKELKRMPNLLKNTIKI